MKSPLSIDELEICHTEDNSVTVLHRTLDAHYRSTHGASAESKWVFFDGCRLINQTEWRVLEVGFGLGTNLQTLLKQRDTCDVPPELHYIGLDHQPIPSVLIDELQMTHPKMSDILRSLLSQIETGLSKGTYHYENVTIELWAMDLHNADLPSNWANAIFHDPFGPSTNPESWTPEVFQTLATSLQPHGILSTYGAAGHARRAMVSAGMWTASTKGFGRKREMTLASKDPAQLEHGTLIKKYVPVQL